MEFIQPADSYPSFWSELLVSEGPLIHHFGVAVEPASAFESTRSGFAAAGFPTVQMGMGSWGCYAYIGKQEEHAFVSLRVKLCVQYVCVRNCTSCTFVVRPRNHTLIADARATLGGVVELLGNGIACEAPH